MSVTQSGRAVQSVLLSLLLAAAAMNAAGAVPDPVDKRQFNLFNPTPRQHLRELSADRPDVTESPYTVDAGHVQLEMSFVDYVYDDEDGVRAETFTVAPLNLKLGLLNNLDVHFVVDPYVRVEVDDAAGEETFDGFGDTQLRLKLNLWGNDTPGSALAVMPFVKLPTADDELSNDDVEGGIIVPFATDIGGGFSLGAIVEFDFVRDSEDESYTTEILHTLALGHDIVGDLAGYVEYIGVAPFEDDADYQASLGFGLTYGLSDDVQFDVGAAVGLNDEADDFNVFTGITVRL